MRDSERSGLQEHVELKDEATPGVREWAVAPGAVSLACSDGGATSSGSTWGWRWAAVIKGSLAASTPAESMDKSGETTCTEPSSLERLHPQSIQAPHGAPSKQQTGHPQSNQATDGPSVEGAAAATGAVAAGESGPGGGEACRTVAPSQRWQRLRPCWASLPIAPAGNELPAPLRAVCAAKGQLWGSV